MGRPSATTDPNDPSSLSPGPQRIVVRDSHGVVWTATYGGGLDRLDGQRVTHFRNDPNNSDSLADDEISSLVPDPKEGLWIGVHGKGLDYFDGQHFTHFSPEPKNPAGLPTPPGDPCAARSAAECSGSAPADLGLVRFDTHTRKFTTYLMDPTPAGQPGRELDAGRLFRRRQPSGSPRPPGCSASIRRPANLPATTPRRTAWRTIPLWGSWEMRRATCGSARSRDYPDSTPRTETFRNYDSVRRPPRRSVLSPLPRQGA